MTHEHRRIAIWRFQQISTLLDPRFTAAERRRMMEAMAEVSVVWPSGRVAPVGLSTLYRWLSRYQKDPRIESLMPDERTVTKASPAIKPEWLEYALALLEQEPKRSLFILGLKIRDRFGLEEAPAKSSLHRTLKKEPRYRKLRRRARSKDYPRIRFQAARVHDIWQGDAKASFQVRFTDGTSKKVQVLSLIDDASRYILRALVVRSESTKAAVATFRQAAARWGLPRKLYTDRHSTYDSKIFRDGLAVLGVHRIETRAGDPPPRGKIEAYHRDLKLWFITELKHQLVLDLRHLQELLDATIDQVYHEHWHKELKMTPRQAFGNRLSKRLVTLERLREAFMTEKDLCVNPTTGDVRVKNDLFKVPRFLANERRAKIYIDPEDPATPYIKLKPGVFEPLKPAVRIAGQTEKHNLERKDRVEPAGSLTPLLERYRGRRLPQARAGFGLPEIYQLFSEALGRRVPATEAEAASVLEWLGKSGPFDPDAFHRALQKAVHRLGAGRPLAQLIQALDRMIQSPVR